MSLTLEKSAHTESAGTLAARVGRRLRARRKQRGMLLREVAARVGTSVQTIQRFEAGTMTLSVDWIERIAPVLELEPFELFADGVAAKALGIAMKAQAQRNALLEAFQSFCSVVEDACHEQTKS
jgi:transcriptional regulator with XRE-family HTH domain